MDALFIAADSALRTVFAQHHASRPMPQSADNGAHVLSDAEKRESAALMRVNHVGEVCAQALYTAQALATRDPALRQRIDYRIREMKNDGRYNAIFRQYDAEPQP